MNELDIRDQNELASAMKLSNDFVEKQYLAELSDHKVLPISAELQKQQILNHIRMFKINKLVHDKNENVIDKLSSVYSALGNVNSSVIMILDSDGINTDLYLGVRTHGDNGSVLPAYDILRKSFEGHFPGSAVDNMANSKIEALIQNITRRNDGKSEISSVSGIPSLKDTDKNQFVQGLEKLADAMKGEAYSAVFIADSIDHRTIADIRLGYENLYSQLVPFAKSDFSFGLNDSQAVTEGITQGFTQTVSESLTKTQSHTQSSSTSDSHSTNTSKTTSLGAAAAGIGSLIGSIGGVPGALIGGALGGVVGSFIGSTTKGESHSSSTSSSSSDSKGLSEMNGASEANSTSESKSDTLTSGQSRSLQLSFENKAVAGWLEKIDEQLGRLKGSEDYGLWNCACYFISPEQQVSRVAASTFKAIMRGDHSSLEHSFINTWHRDKDEANLLEVGKYIQKLSHPLIGLQTNNGLNLPHVTPGSMVSGRELCIPLGLPRKSMNGLPVVESAEFGRSVFTVNASARTGERRTVRLGSIHHMGRNEATPVEIDIDSLTMHTFITGSTGSGKSNTVYHLLNELNSHHVKFLVIEPAKGEYKEVFGGRRDVQVLGTNPNLTKMLKINPFRFPEQIHILEHIDRLVEIFNACWPMYAAMPAVLKDAIEQAYERCGWDLEQSLNLTGTRTFPGFKLLLSVMPDVISGSGYSEEMKGNYNGALTTRVKSLTNGLVGRIFAEDEIDNRLLFDDNCIIDLSRIGSMETKSLLMGILFMRLQEHRMAYSEQMNSSLKHVTVLEEAHHLLRRTSSDQHQESSNLQGKSVEMIANAIAEMRTYGEGFVIADQAPNLLDSSVIRNTNTKMIMRLPDGSDRQEVGASANLNEEQIQEIPRFQTGVAAVYQNNWLLPVLCAVEEFTERTPYVHAADAADSSMNRKRALSDLMHILLHARITEEKRIDPYRIDLAAAEHWAADSGLAKESKEQLLANLALLKAGQPMPLWQEEQFPVLAKLVDEIFDGRRWLKLAKQARDVSEWNRAYLIALRQYADLGSNMELEQAVIQCLLKERTGNEPEMQQFYFAWIEHSSLLLQNKGTWL